MIMKLIDNVETNNKFYYRIVFKQNCVPLFGY